MSISRTSTLSIEREDHNAMLIWTALIPINLTYEHHTNDEKINNSLACEQALSGAGERRGKESLQRHLRNLNFLTQNADWWIFNLVISSSLLAEIGNSLEIPFGEACENFTKYRKFSLELRPEKRQAANALVQGSDVLAVLPTGFGKFQAFVAVAVIERNQHQTTCCPFAHCKVHVIDDQISEAGSSQIRITNFKRNFTTSTITVWIFCFWFSPKPAFLPSRQVSGKFTLQVFNCVYVSGWRWLAKF